MAEEKEAVGQMNARDASTNDSSSLSRQSTGGPRAPEGKETSKHNSLKHGIFSKVVVSRGTFDKRLNGLCCDLQPVGELEQILVEKIATLAWRYRRLIGTEVKNSTNIDFFDPEKARWNSDHLLRYEASIERAFDRALTQLERKQRMRLGQPILPPIKLDLGSA
jgi:hypothetical protein